MSAGRTVAAIDLGAESGRVVRVRFDGRRLEPTEIGRFTHSPVPVDGILRWDLDRIERAVVDHLGTLAVGGDPVAAVGVDAWGVDYGLLSSEGTLLDLPTCYRDPRQVRAMDEALAAVGRDRLYRSTGIQLNEINTVFALMADARTTRLDEAATLLMLPDVVHHLLCGSRVTEFTAASTTGLYDMAERHWAVELADELGIPSRLLPEVVPPGTDLGPLTGRRAAGALAGARVIAPAGHDTASAVVATPFCEPGALFISSGTWSLVGVEVADAVVTTRSQAANLTNEGGYAGTVRLLRNVMGLWILQECRRAWAREGHTFSYAELAALAGREPLLSSVINPNAREFLGPGDMPARVQEHCRRTGQPVPETPGAVARCVVDALALSYRATLEDITAVTGHRPGAVHVTGGGARHALLAQLTADATGLPVHCGPVEATALGNAAVQLAALGELAGVADIRAAVLATAELRTYLPRPDARWAEAAARLAGIAREDDRRRGLLTT